MILEKSDKRDFPWLLVLFSALTLVCLFYLNRDIKWASLVFSVLLMIIALFISTDDLICLIAVVLPTGNIFKLPVGYTSIPFLLLIYIFRSLIKNGKKLSIDTIKPILWIGVLFLFSVFSSFSNNIDLIDIIPFFMHLLFIVIALRINKINDEENYNRIALYFISGTFLVCIFTQLFPAVSRSLSNISVYSKSNPGFASTWDFGRSLSISIAFLVVRVFKKRKHIFIHLILIVFMLYFLIQCGRFSMLLGLGALLICVPIIYSTNKPFVQRIIYSIVLFCVMIGIAYLIYTFVYSSMTELRGYGASENGRFGVWKSYFEYLNNNPLVVLFGVGGGAISSIADILGIATAHNIILEKIVELGIVGLLIFYMYFTALYKDKTFSFSSNWNILPLITFLGTSLTQGTTGNVAFAMLLAMCVVDKYNEQTIPMEAANETEISVQDNTKQNSTKNESI